MPSLYTRFSIHAPFDPQCLYVTSPILPPLALAFVRLLLATYIIISIEYILVIDTVHLQVGAVFFAYSTRLSWIGVMAYLFAGGMQTLFCALNLRRRFATSSVDEDIVGINVPRAPMQCDAKTLIHRGIHTLIRRETGAPGISKSAACMAAPSAYPISAFHSN